MARKVRYQQFSNEKEEKKMVTNTQSLYDIIKEKGFTFQDIIDSGFKYAEEKYDVEDPFDKSKYREVIISEEHNHDLFKGASGGKGNDDTYGADATEIKSGHKVEYKSAKMTKAQYLKFLNGTLKKQYFMVYNGAYDMASIERYKDTKHYLSLFYKGTLVTTVHVPTDYVIDTLSNVLAEKEIKRESGDIVTTNCNSVKVQWIDSEPTIGEVVENDIRE
jgi:hypothetical protein